jgi:hypothetical protein
MRTAAVVAAVTLAAACSSSTSPSSSGSGSGSALTGTGSAAKGDSINLSGTYDLASYTVDSADNNSSTTPANSSNGGTLVLTSTTFNLTWLGSFSANNGSGQSGSYVAVDTSSSADRGTIALTSSKTQSGTYQFSTDTLTVNLPQSDGSTDVTVWIKQ